MLCRWNKKQKKHGKHGSKHGDDKGGDYKKSEEYKEKSEEYKKKSEEYEKSEEYKKKSEEYEKKSEEEDDYKYVVEEEDQEWYESKVDTDSAAKLTGYEPKIYCKKMEVKMAA